MTDYAHYIKERVNITDVAERAGIALKFNKACCPFHNEKTPSFSIQPKKNIFKCFGCGVSGDVIEFVKLFYNTDFIGAVRLLNDDYGLGLKFGGDSVINAVPSQYKLDSALKQVYKEKFKRYETALINYRQSLYRRIISYIPPREIADFSNEYVKAVNSIEKIDYYCDIMAYGKFEDKQNLIKQKEVTDIERMYGNE